MKEEKPDKDSSVIHESNLKMGDDISEEVSKLDINQSEVKKLNHNQSGKSLAYSHNDESSLNLKFSRAQESAVHEMVNKKLDEELVLEISHFSRNKFRDFL